jgi:protein SCO1/2
MSKRTFLITIGLLVGAFVATLGFGYFVWQDSRENRANLLGGPFELVDHTGTPRNQDSWPDQYKLMYFGYTYCPDFCPTTLTVMTEALNALPEPVAARIKPLLISVDPERDTVETLAQYHEHFDPRFSMMTGTPEQVRAAARAYGIYYAKAESDAATEYLMDHSTFTYLMAPNGDFVTHFGHGITGEEMAKTLAEVISD